MIRAYTRTNQHQEALKLFHLMQHHHSIQPDKFTFTFALKACTGVSDLAEGRLIHGEIVNRNLERDVFIGTGLVDMYCKLNDLGQARKVFDKMPNKDVVAWNAMISGLAQSTDPKEAMEFFMYMQGVGLEPNSVSFLNLFPAVCKLMDLDTCMSIHGYILRRDFPVAVFNGLIDMYAKCGYPDIARLVLDQMKSTDDVTWGTIMSGYAYNGEFSKTLELFDFMKRNSNQLKMNKVSAVTALLAASEMKDLDKGLEIHDFAVKLSIDSDVMVATSLMTMYAKCGELEKVYELFSQIQERDLVSWSAVISAFAQPGYSEEALTVFRQMQNENMRPNLVTLVSVLPSCGELSFVKLGKSVHCFAIKDGIETDISLGTAIVSMYARCGGMFASALTVFSRMPFKEIVTWNALINGYAQIDDPYEPIRMFSELKVSGFHPDSGTIVGVLPACALLGDLNLVSQVHAQVIKYGFESDSHVENSLIDVYAKCGSILSAELLFNQTVFTRDEVSWNVLIAGYMHNGHAERAISLFHRMKFEGFVPNLVTIISILPAASYLAALREGMAIHAYIIQRGFMSYTLIGNGLVDMYAKCGRLDYSEQSFSEMKYKDVVSWNTMLGAYSVHGLGHRALEIFSLMQESDVKIDSISFISILSACRHAGLIEEGRKVFDSMRVYKVEPNLEHYACMVDLLGRGGLFDEILDLLKEMPMKADAGVWGAMLDACKMHSNVKLGEVALKQLSVLEQENRAHYVVLSNIYSQSGRWDDARDTRSKMNEIRVAKVPGCSWVDVKKNNRYIS